RTGRPQAVGDCGGRRRGRQAARREGDPPRGASGAGAEQAAAAGACQPRAQAAGRSPDDLVDQRGRTQQRLRWHLHQLDPTYEVPLRRLDRVSHLDRVGRWLARREQELQVRLARELVATIRALNRAIGELEQELEQRTAAVAPALLDLPGCAALTAAKLLAEIGPIDRFKTARSWH